MLAGLTFGLGLAGGSPLAAQNSCQAVNDAMNKVTTVPTHIYMDMATVLSSGAEPEPTDMKHAETIYVGTSAFTKLRGKWERREWTPQNVAKQEQESRQAGKFSCQYLRDEPIHGEIAAIYGTHSERDKVESDGRVWISKSRGLPLRRELDIGMTSGTTSKNHVSTRYEYSNVHAPF
jgi:hypothetical protein